MPRTTGGMVQKTTPVTQACQAQSDTDDRLTTALTNCPGNEQAKYRGDAGENQGEEAHTGEVPACWRCANFDHLPHGLS